STLSARVVRRATWLFTVSAAVPPLPSFTVTVTGTDPSCCGAVQSVCRSAGLASVPVGTVHRYVSGSPSGSCPVAVTVELLPISTVHGSHCARTVGGRFCGAGGGGGGGGGGGAGGTYTRTPG